MQGAPAQMTRAKRYVYRHVCGHAYRHAYGHAVGHVTHTVGKLSLRRLSRARHIYARAMDTPSAMPKSGRTDIRTYKNASAPVHRTHVRVARGGFSSTRARLSADHFLCRSVQMGEGQGAAMDPKGSVRAIPTRRICGVPPHRCRTSAFAIGVRRDDKK